VLAEPKTGTHPCASRKIKTGILVLTRWPAKDPDEATERECRFAPEMKKAGSGDGKTKIYKENRANDHRLEENQ
jgi:hypothetical protein